MTYYVVVYRWIGSPLRPRGWDFADQRAAENSYESYPVMYTNRARAEKYAAEFLAERAPGEKYETQIIPVEIDFPEAK